MIEIDNAIELWQNITIIVMIGFFLGFIFTKANSKESKADLNFSYSISFSFIKALLYLFSINILYYTEKNINEGYFDHYKAILIVILVINFIESVKNIIELLLSIRKTKQN